MKPLRHPIRVIREPFGKAGLIVACIALVAALGGSALAAKHLFTKAQEKQIAKIAKKFAGKPGPAGANGVPGPQGAPGAAGKDGTNGANGTNGTPGAPGAPGTNGTFSTEPLPSGQTLTGMWSAGLGKALTEIEGYPPAGSRMDTSISFPIEVAPAPVALIPWEINGNAALGSLGAELKDGEFSTYGPNSPNIETMEQFVEDQEAYEEACPGTFEEPQAAKGFLCVYVDEGNLEQMLGESPAFEAAHPFGVNIPFSIRQSNPNLTGSWAVTAG